MRRLPSFLSIGEGVSDLVAAGESSFQEFKSTLRWDLRKNKRNDEITHAVLKTIAAFANTEGGSLGAWSG